MVAPFAPAKRIVTLRYSSRFMGRPSKPVLLALATA
jgi:hypothetical protein